MLIWSMISGVYIFAAGIVAFILSALCGGGASFILMPLLGMVLPGAQIPAALSIGTFSSSASRTVVFFRNIRWDVVKYFVPTAIPAVWLGAWVLTFVNPVYLEVLLGLFLVSNISLLLHPVVLDQKKISKYYLFLIGGGAGFVSGLTGAVGLLFNRFYLQYGLTKEEVVATRAANEILLHVFKLCLYASFGLLTGKVWFFGLLLLVAALIAALLSKKVLSYLNEKLFQRIGYFVMVLAGIYMSINATRLVLHQQQFNIRYQAIETGIETRMQWLKTSFSMEFEYDEGFELEYPAQFEQLPKPVQKKALTLIKGADKVIYEEVYGINKHSYEVYVYRAGKLEKFDL